MSRWILRQQDSQRHLELRYPNSGRRGMLTSCKGQTDGGKSGWMEIIIQLCGNNEALMQAGAQDPLFQGWVVFAAIRERATPSKHHHHPTLPCLTVASLPQLQPSALISFRGNGKGGSNQALPRAVSKCGGDTLVRQIRGKAWPHCKTVGTTVV